jgi:hypothetical protein
MKAKCDNCSKVWDLDDLEDPIDLNCKVDIGGEMPAGECPDCGSLAYKIKHGTFIIIHTTYKREPPPMLDILRDDDGWPYTYETYAEAWEAAKEHIKEYKEFEIVMLNEDTDE